MKRLHFSDSHKEFFAQSNLKSFEDFFEHPKGQLINKNKKRDVHRFELGTESHRRVLFLKRFHHPYFKDIIHSSRNTGHLCSQAAYEWENTRLLFENSIDTYRPVCFGEEFKCGIERNSFLVTELVEAEEFKDFIGQNWGKLSIDEKNQIIRALGKFINKIHQANISLPDLYVWHLFIKQHEGRWCFTVIDFHRMVRNVTDIKKKIQNLGRLDHSMTDKYFSPSEKQFLVESYASQNCPIRNGELFREVTRHSSAVSSKRKPKPY